MSDPTSPLRLFLALWPEVATRTGLVAWQHCWAWPPRAARVRPERLHMTLHFLGDVPAERLPALIRGVDTPTEAFDLQFGRAELWPGGIAVLRPRHTPPALVRLHDGLGAALRRLELPVESRPFRAHVTLARRAAGATPPKHGPELGWPVDAGYALVRSLPGGAGYAPVQVFA
jgi:RNA 2',3'-cyclic 3'-phosphodiesterase